MDELIEQIAIHHYNRAVGFEAWDETPDYVKKECRNTAREIMTRVVEAGWKSPEEVDKIKSVLNYLDKPYTSGLGNIEAINILKDFLKGPILRRAFGKRSEEKI